MKGGLIRPSPAQGEMRDVVVVVEASTGASFSCVSVKETVKLWIALHIFSCARDSPTTLTGYDNGRCVAADRFVSFYSKRSASRTWIC
jgi:hypothetical protein